MLTVIALAILAATATTAGHVWTRLGRQDQAIELGQVPDHRATIRPLVIITLAIAPVVARQAHRVAHQARQARLAAWQARPLYHAPLY